MRGAFLVTSLLMVATTLVIFVPLLVFRSAALLAATRASFPKEVRDGKLSIPKILRSFPNKTLLLLQLGTTRGPILPLEKLGVALTRVTKLTDP